MSDPKLEAQILMSILIGSLACRCVPSFFSPEMGLILIQGCLLVSRTWFTDVISRIEARAGRHLIAEVGFCCPMFESFGDKYKIHSSAILCFLAGLYIIILDVQSP